jgi:hypothetical protein
VRLLGAAIASLSLAAAARGDRLPEAPPEVVAERDRLIDRIARGESYQASVQRFRALALPLYLEKETAEADRKRRDEADKRRRTWLEAYRKSADYAVGERCTLAVDPSAAPRGRWVADWGPVVRREKVILPPKNALDPGEERILYEVAGVARTYLIDGTRYRFDHAPLEARPGELVLICTGGGISRDARLPPEWHDATHEGFAVRIARPPRIAEKGRLAPEQVRASSIESDAAQVRWDHAPDAHLLVHAEIGEPAGEGRYAMGRSSSGGWLLEVPARLRSRPALVPGQMAWLIVGRQRWDREARKLVLELEDIDERYVIEKEETPGH